jgi:putative transposase
MGNYTEVYYHFAWATKRREASIVPAIEPLLHDYIRHHCQVLGVMVHAVNGMPDHVHLACTLPAALSASEAIGKIKGASAWFINQKAKWEQNLSLCLYWQANYGALTFARHDLPRIIRYIDNQKAHHETGRISERLERCDDGHIASSAPKGLLSV